MVDQAIVPAAVDGDGHEVRARRAEVEHPPAIARGEGRGAVGAGVAVNGSAGRVADGPRGRRRAAPGLEGAVGQCKRGRLRRGRAERHIRAGRVENGNLANVERVSVEGACDADVAHAAGERRQRDDGRRQIVLLRLEGRRRARQRRRASGNSRRRGQRNKRHDVRPRLRGHVRRQRQWREGGVAIAVEEGHDCFIETVVEAASEFAAGKDADGAQVRASGAEVKHPPASCLAVSG